MRELMNRSSKFLSLSGFSGIIIGTYALIAAGLVIYICGSDTFDPESFSNYLSEYRGVQASGDYRPLYCTGIAFMTLVLSLGTAFYFSRKKAKKNNEALWSPSSKIVLTQLFIPLIIGFLFCATMAEQHYFKLIIPATLIFYGLALVNVGKYTFDELTKLGIIEAFLGIIATGYLEYSIYFWAFGFGVLHIIYGFAIHRKYERGS